MDHRRRVLRPHILASTRRGIGAVLATFLALVTLPAVAHADEGPPGTARAELLSGWLPYWADESEVGRIVDHGGPGGLIDEVNAFWAYSRYGRGSDSAVCVHDGTDRPESECAPERSITSAQHGAVSRLHAGGVRVLLTFTDSGAPGALARMLASPERRATHIRAQVRAMEANGFDGIDLDYEGFAFHDDRSTWSATRPAWVAYVRELGHALHARGALLSVTVPAGVPQSGPGFADSAGYPVYAWSEIIGSVDRLRVMTYDHAWSTPGPVGPVAWVDEVAADAVEQLGSGNARKVWLGIAAYGYDWRTSGTCGQPRTTVVPAGAALLAADAAARRWGRVPLQSLRFDEASGEYSLRYAQVAADCRSEHEVWFQGARSHLLRAQIAARHRLGGVSLWALGDESPDTWSTLQEGAASVRPYVPAVGLVASRVVTVGRRATAVAKVTAPSGAPVVGARVRFAWRPAGGVWGPVTTAVTDHRGEARARAVVGASGEWQVTSDEAAGRQASSSPFMVTIARGIVTAAVLTRSPTGRSARASVGTPQGLRVGVDLGARTEVAGRVIPAGRHRVMLVEERPDGTTHTLASALTGATGRYRIAIPTGTVGSSVLRILASDTTRGGTVTVDGGISRPVLLEVR